MEEQLDKNIIDHICLLIMEIDLHQNKNSPLKKSNSFLKLKEFADNEFKKKYKVAEEFKELFSSEDCQE